VEVLSRSTVALPLFSNKELLRSASVVSTLHASSEKEVANGEAVAQQESGVNTPERADKQLIDETVAALRSTIASFEPVWTASSVILPPDDFMALNLDLPFGDSKNLDRIVDLEVQDVVPFELDPFFVQYAPLGTSSAPANAGQFDVHIGMLPRQVVLNVLEVCKKSGLEPNVLTVPSSAIGAVYHLAKDFFVGNSAIIYNRGDEYCISVFINGEVRVERSVYASQIIAANVSPESRQEKLQHIFTALKLVMASAERRYNATVERVYLLGREVKGANTSQLFGRPLEGLLLKDLVSSGEAALGLSPLTAIFAKDESDAAPLSNFRARQFSFTPKISEFMRALLGTRRHVVRAIAGVLLALLVVFLSREYLISSSESALVDRVRTVIPDFAPEPDKVLESLAKAEGKLGQELVAFGSRSKHSPSDALIQFVKLIPESADLSITSLRISGDSMLVQGTANQVTAIERFAKTLSAQKEIFANVTPKPSRTTSGFSFTLTITLTQ
jgi:hypothetical protein